MSSKPETVGCHSKESYLFQTMLQFPLLALHHLPSLLRKVRQMPSAVQDAAPTYQWR